MRPVYAKITATALLAVCVYLIVRQSGGNVGGRMRGETKPASGNARTTATRAFRPEPSISSKPSANRSGRDPAAVAGRVADPEGEPPQSISNHQVRAIQLAENVRLPAVLMVPDPTETNLQCAPAPAVTAATRQIAGSFYQELAAGTAIRPSAVEKPVAGILQPSDTPADDDNTTVIEPGPVVENARSRANEAYRALFGDDAYNRRTMDSAIEVSLPVDSASTQP
jgi:hypothetical protein